MENEKVQPASDRVRVRRSPKRGQYDFKTISQIIDATYICSVGIVQDGQPVVLPMVHGRINKTLYLHGATSSRLMKALTNPTCIAITQLDGLVLARSAFHHSMNYRSVVLMANGRVVDDADEKLSALKAFSDHIMPGRWSEVRGPSPKEFKATTVVAFPIEEASAKIRSGPPIDDDEDYELNTWAGVIPLELTMKKPKPDPKLKEGIELPEHIATCFKT